MLPEADGVSLTTVVLVKLVSVPSMMSNWGRGINEDLKICVGLSVIPLSPGGWGAPP